MRKLTLQLLIPVQFLLNEKKSRCLNSLLFSNVSVALYLLHYFKVQLLLSYYIFADSCYFNYVVSGSFQVIVCHINLLLPAFNQKI